MQYDSSNIAVIVTGGARGLGRVMTLALLRWGIRVAVALRVKDDPEGQGLADLAAQEGCEDRLLVLQCDVTDPRQCFAAIEKVIFRFGAVHGLVNNAGIGMQGIGNVLVGKRKPFYEVGTDAWRMAIDVNVNGAFMMAKAIVPHLAKQGWGRIVNIGTSLSTMMMPGFSPYGPSKAALESATVIWSKDLAGTGVTVNMLVPGGPVNTRMIPETEVVDRSTLIQPEVMIAPIVWLMSPVSDGVTGRRIVAKEWNAERVTREGIDAVAKPAGW